MEKSARGGEIFVWYTCDVVCIWETESNLDWSPRLERFESVELYRDVVSLVCGVSYVIKSPSYS
jgi:hypothetical protein